MDQVKLIHETNWDVLIILDACRFDYFIKVNDIEGYLIQAYSPATCTVEWLKRVFNGYYDVTYISGNPIVNSVGVPIMGYRAKDHFKRIIDVWDFGWDNELSTVPPWNINKYALKYIDKKMIIHYMQPHGVYIGEPKLIFRKRGTPHDVAFGDIYVVEKIRRGELTVELLRKAYEGNLRLVLKYVKELVEKLPHKKIVVTADHGELLGEDGLFLHPCDRDHRILRIVPWLEIEKG